MTLQPGTKLGNYELIEKIGAGGMGAVYKAYQPALGRYVAIKVLPPQTSGDPKFAERFAQEAKAIGKLRHPNIVTAFDFAYEGDLAFLVSEFIDGGTLADQLGSPLPLDYTLQLLTPLASALDYAHARGVVHRDIKPQNILMSHEGTPVLTDFGLAKIVGPGSGMTQAGSLMGTAEYIAPELASGSEVAGPPADQYALGLIAYQMLCGRHPFPADNPLSALMAHVHKPVPIPSTLGIALPPGAEAALLRALAKRPEERFARCGDFTKALAGSAFAGMGAMPAMAPIISPSPSPPQAPAPGSPPPPIAPTAAAPSDPEVSALLSPAALVTPIERSASTPPSQTPAASTPASQPPAPSTPAAVAGGATAIIPPRPLAKPKTPWWRGRRMLLVVAVLIILVILALPKQELLSSIAGTETRAGRTQRPTQPPPTATSTTSATPTTSPTPTTSTTPTSLSTATPAATAQPTNPVVVTPTPVRTPAPTVAPTPAPTLATGDDHGNTPATATSVAAGQLNGGTIEPSSDVDWFRISVPANNQIFVELKGRTLSGGAIALFVGSPSTGGVTQVGVEDVDNGAGANILATARDAGVYFVRVRSAKGDTGAYTVAVGLIPR